LLLKDQEIHCKDMLSSFRIFEKLSQTASSSPVLYEEEVTGLLVGQQNFSMQCFWHLALGWFCLATASVSDVDSRLCCPLT
jgi:hypothetical protein